MSTYDFRMIRPLDIVDALLTSSSVPEAVVAVYDAGTTYADGDVRGVTTGTSQIVYESLQAANIGHTPASSPTWWQETGVVYAAYAGGTTYALGDIVSSVSSDVHERYESLTAGNVGNALTDTAKWLPLGKTNRWRMFDKSVQSQSVAPDQIVAVLTPGEIVNTVALLNVEGATATISQSVSGYSQTKSLVQHEVLTWYDWYYEEPIRAGDVVFDDIPPYAGATLTVTIANPGADAALGCCFVGKARTIGSTQWGVTAGILSYSGTTTDAFGNTTIVRRSTAKRLNFNVQIASGFESEAYRLLTLYTDVEMVFIGSTDYSMTFAYGYLGQWEVPISNTGKPATIEIRGLT